MAQREIVAVDRIESIARHIWGNEHDAADWLNKPHPLFGGASPRSLLDDDAGRAEVENLLGALDNGFPVLMRIQLPTDNILAFPQKRRQHGSHGQGMDKTNDLIRSYPY